MAQNSEMYNDDDQNGQSDQDIHPALIDDDDDFENGGREPIDLSAGVFEPGDLEALLHPKRKAAKPADQNGDAPATVETSGPTAEAAAKREAELLAEIETQKNNYLRAVADIHNIRRRNDEAMERLRHNANERLIKEILPLKDDLDLCIDAAKKSESYEQLITGVEAIYRKFQDILTKEHVAEVASVGEQFNPDVHEAVMLDAGSEHPDNTVTDELRKGYTLNGRLIRPALVKVAKS